MDINVKILFINYHAHFNKNIFIYLFIFFLREGDQYLYKSLIDLLN